MHQATKDKKKKKKMMMMTMKKTVERTVSSKLFRRFVMFVTAQVERIN
jgi:hypothetical protein